MDYRHEWKHIIAPEQLPELRQRLRVVARPDPHARDGRYRIRSLYFDDLADTALREKQDGVSRREKYRIRCYEMDFDNIHLECKRKLGGLGHKDACPLSRQEVSAILSGDIGWMAGDGRELMNRLYIKMHDEDFAPKTIVDYTREPFVYAPGNVRVTLDYGIRTGLRSTAFLDADCPTLPVPGDPIILEVKWDAFLPDIIRDAVQLDGVRTSAFSKYAACRMYD